METTLSVIAILVSLGLLIVHWQNQIERRHSELVALKVQLLARAETLLQACNSTLMTIKVIRLAIRQLPDSEDKYESIERMPRLLTKTEAVAEKARGLRDAIRGFDTKKRNKQSVLIGLQAAIPELDDLARDASTLEGLAQGLVDHVELNIAEPVGGAD